MKRTADIGCAHHVEARSDRRMLILDCEGCTGDSDLSSRRCYEGAVRALFAVGPIEGIILSGYVETEYKGVALDALKGLRTLASYIERAAGRDPLVGISGAAGRERSKRCASCSSHPSAVMGNLRDWLSKDLDSFSASLQRARHPLASSNHFPECGACVAETGEDVQVISSEFDSFKGRLVRGAFGIVTEAGQ